MDILFEKITEGLRNILIQAITMCLTGMFTDVNEKTSLLAGEVGKTPQAFNPQIFEALQKIHSEVAVPIAGVVVTFVLSYELVSMLTDYNRMQAPDLITVAKWLAKAVLAISIAGHAFDIIMGVFDIGQWVVQKAEGTINSGGGIDAAAAIAGMDLSGYSVGELLLLLLESFLFSSLMFFITVGTTIVVYVRMVEIYMYASIAAVPMATFTDREFGSIGKNYLKGIIALSMQGFFLMVCIGIYDALVKNLAITGNVFSYFPQIAVYTVLLLIVLFKTGQVAKSVFDVH